MFAGGGVVVDGARPAKLVGSREGHLGGGLLKLPFVFERHPESSQWSRAGEGFELRCRPPFTHR